MSEEITTLRKELDLTQKQLEASLRELAELRKLMDTLSDNIERIKFETERKIGRRIITEILPEFRSLKNHHVSEQVRAKIRLIEERLRLIIPTADNPYSILILLSAQEIQIASMIKDGYKSSQISGILNISNDTVKAHRRNIRRKLHLTGKDVELGSYLKSVFA